MERRILKKVEQHQLQFKHDIKEFFNEKKCALSSNHDSDLTSDFMKFIFDYGNLTLSKDDFKKRKRIKNPVPQYERCNAKRANGEQCTRRKKEGELNCFCGTHIKGSPHGIVDLKDADTKKTTKIEVWVQEIKGINYYVDNEKNVYLPEDILSNSVSPRIIGTWQFIDGEYHIPNLNM
jgi:hypothetical protein